MKTWKTDITFSPLHSLLFYFRASTLSIANQYRKACLVGVLFLFLAVPAVSQKQSIVDIPTPNAASLGQYGQVPVSTFNGLTSISIPIYDFRYKDIYLPISLSYHAGGNRTEDYPGWVGLGWTLNAGGSITRIVNGKHDEIHTNDLNKTVSSGAGYDIAKDYGYFYHSDKLDNPNWFTQAFMVNYVENNNLLYSGLMPFDAEPDEFIFNAGDLSGSFFMVRDQHGNLVVKVKSKSGEHLKIEPVVSTSRVELSIFMKWEDREHDYKAKMERSFMGFTIIRSNGMKYHFGGEVTSMDMNTVRTGSSFTTIATSWHLTKIESPDKYAITLQYKKEGDVFIQAKNRSQQCIIGGYNNTGDECYPVQITDETETSYSLQHPSYLSKIVAPDGRTVEFQTSPSNQRIYDYGDKQHLRNVFNDMPDPFHDEFLLGNYYLQLDKIKIDGGPDGRVYPRIEATFNYTSSANQRLKLQELTIAPPNDEANKQNYAFSYNSHSLPAFNSKLSDNWGYYNNKYYGNVTDFEAMYGFRSADTAFTKAEILEKIIYPTGGETIFKFEAHDYSKFAKQFPFELVDESGIAGGLRIKKIISRISPSDTKPMVWEYSYVNEDGTSSGILSGKPVYRTFGKQQVDIEYSSWDGLVFMSFDREYEQTYSIHTEYPQYPMSSTNGNHVTYSRVVEKMVGNGYTVYNYSNNDLYPDEPPLGFFYNSEGKMIYNAITSRELERGLLLSKKVFSENNQPVAETIYEYNDDPLRYEDYVKSINYVILKGEDTHVVRLAAKKIYTFYPYLKRQTTISYRNGNAISSAVTYGYDPIYKLVKEEQTINSKGELLKTRYSYPTNFTDNQVFQSMKEANLISSPVESLRLKDSKVVEGEALAYSCFGCTTDPETGLLEGGVFKPAQKFKLETAAALDDYTPATAAFNLDQRMKPYLVFDRYDGTGNILSYRQVDHYGNTTAKGTYLWGYHEQFPTAQVLHGSEGEVAFTSFEEASNTGSWIYSPGQESGTSHSGYYSYKGSTLSKATLPDNSYVVSLWAKGTAPITVNGQEPVSIMPAVGSDWREYKWVLLNPGTVTITNNGLNYVDDVRLHPASAMMTTYTYDLFGNMSSNADANNTSTFFMYDDFNRLKQVKDGNGNIVKYFEYKYRQ